MQSAMRYTKLKVMLSQFAIIASLLLFVSKIFIIGASETNVCSTTSTTGDGAALLDGTTTSCISDIIEPRSDIVAREKFRTISNNDDDLIIKRRTFPEEEPLICLAFLSCCGRTDLLEQTMKGIIRHMEEDEPRGLRYEIAWVDNGSGKEKQQFIASKFQIEHAVTVENMGLAWGMNALAFDMCTAPYIMLLEEDWLYMDEAVAEQTITRKISIALGLSVLMSNPVDKKTGMPIKGFFLRVENDIMRDRVYDDTLTRIPGSSDQEIKKVGYFPSCMDVNKNGHVFGAFSNGASIYDRGIFRDIGRMYGEPGDIFHDSFVEGNYSFRVGLKYCGARALLEECHDGDLGRCMASFAHIGGGHNTRPNRQKHMECMDGSWNLYGTPYYDVAQKEDCSKDLSDISTQLKKNAEFMDFNAMHNKEVFDREKQEREHMRNLAKMIEESGLHLDPVNFRAQLGPKMSTMSDEDIRNFPSKMRKQADSPHQIPGFWDRLGRPIGLDF